MNPLYIPPGSHTPEVNFKPDQGLFSISGKSFSVNPSAFYQPVHEWFTNFINTASIDKDLILHLDFDYINTSSSKEIARLFFMLEGSKLREKLIVKWSYDAYDSDMQETGERYSSYSKLRFQLDPKGEE
jgi:hypothetical protein